MNQWSAIRNRCVLLTLIIGIAGGVLFFRVGPGSPARHTAAPSIAALSTAGSPAGMAVFACVGLSQPAEPAAGEARVAPVEDIYNLPPRAVGVEVWKLAYYCPGDFNKDNVVDLADLNLYVAVYSAREGPMVEWLDVNRDGEVSMDDLSDMIRAIEEGGCDPEEQSNVRLLIC